VTLRIESTTGAVIRALPAAALQPGVRSLRWDGRMPGGTRAFDGTYVAHLVIASEVGSSERSVSFRFRR
jgi:flagellar hook assembly protein FlgD